MTRTDGKEALATKLKGMRRNGSWLARELKLSANSVSLWLRGRSRPEHHHRLALHRLLGIDPLSWMTAEERKIAGVDEPAPAQVVSAPAVAA